MPRRIITIGGNEWTVSPSGRVTQYTRDEFGLLFTRGKGEDREQRVMRFSPQGSRIPETALAGLTDQQLRGYFAMSQPAWTSPETGYRS